MQERTRAELLAWTPAVYLAEGFLDGAGRAREALTGEDAAAASAQLLAAEVPPQEVGFTVAAMGLLWPEHDEADVAERLRAVAEEALATVARAIQQPINEGFLEWLSACVAAVDSFGAVDALFEHLRAVDRQYGVLAALLPDGPFLPGSASGPAGSVAG